MDEGIAERALAYAQKLGAAYIEARLESTTSNAIVIKNGIVQLASFDYHEGLGMRFIVNKKLGFVSTNELEEKHIQEIIAKAIRITKATKDIGQNTELAKEKSHKATYKVTQKIKLADIGIPERTQLLLDAEKAVKETGVNVPARHLSYGDTDTKEYLITSEGTKILSHIPRMETHYFLTIEENNKVSQRSWSYGASGGWEQAKKWNLPKVFEEEVTTMRTNLLKGKKAPSGKMPIVCGPQVTGIMVHESCGHPYEADRILGREAAQAGESFVTKRMLGTKIASQKVTIVDDPTINNSFGFYRYDNEGVKARRKFLVKKGIITEFLHNRETAYAMGLKSNGSSRAADFDKESIVRMSNTFLLPGDYKEKELFEGVKKGIYMKNFMEWNIDDKRLNQKYTGAEAYLIENGEISTPIIAPVLEVSTLRLWPAVEAIGKNLELHAGSCGKGEPMQGIPIYLGGPSIRLQGLRIK
ncbi:MAG TPA: TldD/PmbA family protein [Candidatus Nanoarchaeia archaeon]|nr:TldD/PmbA family protein [Candidatus Nanoarchaeia archaeon]